MNGAPLRRARPRSSAQHEPKGVTVSVGGEIGEVGGKNSTPEELHAFMHVYHAALARPGAAGEPGLSKISIQTGTVARRRAAARRLDRRRCRSTSTRSERSRSWRASATAWPARCSTAPRRCPAELFDRFPKLGACEIHLATEFQNMLFDHPAFPAELKRAIYAKLRETDGRRAQGRRHATSSSSTRRARRRSASASASCGACRPRCAARSASRSESKFRFLLERSWRWRARGRWPSSTRRSCAGSFPMRRRGGAGRAAGPKT